ncbi:MTAP family purine nucleoside phosphorylase [Pelagicoccus sp. SDUM812002]|uniref:MTAP family purine nucleoside phosphorylase n=1 Tax=Pelagicoccus sp. SDUM812002 TaxID=3041266 RepID=UPI00280EA99D|nr:MTAP family purine nucleoside phosphorylase [Pelagicoccus sp. SDUM812002]MDQ8184407.1 MTAP family purine nucleoside phosphorylase [Pelagicoccus sp. SDUM812002]
MKIAIISGTSIEKTDTFEDWQVRSVQTEFGKVVVKTDGKHVAMNRHGFERALPPHKINYRANIEALCQLEVESVVTLSSVGSVTVDIPPGSLVSCQDYMSFAPMTFIDDRMSAFAPVIGNRHLEAIRSRCSQPILTGKIYMQTPGPRFETRAEVRAVKALGGDLVGMTFANEADLILERGLDLTAFCMVDNYAHGVSSSQLSLEAFRGLVAKNQATINCFLSELVDYLRICS